MTATTEAQLVSLVREQAESAARVASELELLNERVSVLETLGREQSTSLARLVALQEAREGRDQAALEIERAEHAARLSERQARAAWVRGLLGERVLVPLFGAMASALAAGWAYLHSITAAGDK